VTAASKPEKTAVLLLAHGSPDSAEDIPQFLVQVTGGKHLPPPVVEEVKRRYNLIGVSPLTQRTLEQGDLLARELGMPVYVGMRNWKPYIADAVRKMQSDGVQHVIAICLAPQNSRTSTGLYRSALTQHNPPFTIDFIESWHDQPFLIQAFSEKLRAGLQAAEAEYHGKLPIIFTAHSVPERTITEGDPYKDQARETAALVARTANLDSNDWLFAFQSQGMSGGPWLGPTVEDTISQLKQRGHNGVFIQPIGFLCDHVEIRYDIDIGFRQFAEQHEMKLWRAQSLNDSPLLAKALAEVARSRIRQAA
jgi:protoporphyrin/coproporphyrin ferrochelatase